MDIIIYTWNQFVQKKTDSSHLKMDAWNTLAAYFQVIPTVSLREGIYVTIGIFEAHLRGPP